MSWKIEIIRALFVAFGAFQTFTNLTYFKKSNGKELARKQHRELPEQATDKQVGVKVVCMLLLGLLFLGTGLASYLTRNYFEISFIVALGVFVVYALVQALYYRFWRTYGEFVLSIILFVLILLV